MTEAHDDSRNGQYMNRHILVIIPFEITIGFAFSKLIGVFFESCTRAAGTVEDVHFAFSAVGTQSSADLPSGFANLVEFNARQYAQDDVVRLCAYIKEQRIETVFVVDGTVQERYLPDIRKAGVRTVIAYWGAPLSGLNSGLKLLLKRMEVKYLRPSKPDHFIVESQSMKETAIRGRGIPAYMTTIVPTGVDHERFRPLPAHHGDVYEKFSIPLDRSVVVFMGHLHHRKGVHILLQAADQIVKRAGRTDIHFLFLGNRPGEAEAFGGTYDRATTASYITFGGYQSGIPELLAGCHLGCVPTTGWDSFPLSPLEMQASGLPVVVSDCQGLPESVSDGVTGLVVPAGDVCALAGAIQRIVDDKELHGKMSRAAVQRIRASFTRTQQVQALTQVICSVAQWPTSDSRIGKEVLS